MTMSRAQIAAVVRDSLVEHLSLIVRTKVGPRAFRRVREPLQAQ